MFPRVRVHERCHVSWLLGPLSVRPRHPSKYLVSRLLLLLSVLPFYRFYRPYGVCSAFSAFSVTRTVLSMCNTVIARQMWRFARPLFHLPTSRWCLIFFFLLLVKCEQFRLGPLGPRVYNFIRHRSVRIMESHRRVYFWKKKNCLTNARTSTPRDD